MNKTTKSTITQCKHNPRWGTGPAKGRDRLLGAAPKAPAVPLRQELARKMGIDQTAVVELIIRELVISRGIK